MQDIHVSAGFTTKKPCWRHILVQSAPYSTVKIPRFVNDGEQSLFLVGYRPLFGLLFTGVVAFAFTFGCGGCGINYVGEYCESVP